MKRKLIKYIIIAVVVVIVGAGGYFGYTKIFASKTTASTSQYMTVAASKTNLTVNVQGTGTAFAGTSKEISASNAGILKDLTLNVGDTVKKGDKLFASDSDDVRETLAKAATSVDKQNISVANNKNSLSSQIVQGQIAVAEAQNQLNSAVSQNSAAPTNSTAEAVQKSQINLDKLKATLLANQNNIVDTSGLTDAQSQYATAVDQVNKMTVTSPIDGVITQAANVNGDTLQSGKTVLTIIDPASIKVKVAVDEMDINKIVIGQKTQIKFDAVSDASYEGSVESIAQTGTSSNNVTTYDVVVSVSNPTNIKVGMNANVTIIIDSKDDALAVPTDALVDKDGSKYVMVASGTDNSVSNKTNTSTAAKSGTPSRTSGTSSAGGQLVKVTTGLKNENYVEILDGLTEGEKVLISIPSTTTTTSTTTKNSLGGSGFSGTMGGNSGGGRPN